MSADQIYVGRGFGVLCCYRVLGPLDLAICCSYPFSFLPICFLTLWILSQLDIPPGVHP